MSYSYLERFPALDDVSLTIRRGEKIALIGANGCGKSTLLKVLDGLVFPDTGTYRAFDAAVTEENLEDEQFSRGFRSRVGFVFQNSDAQVFSPTVREEIAFGPLNMGLTRDQVNARVDDTLTMLDITDLAERAPYQLSGGQKKRVAIASVLVMNPEVLLFDEPLGALDPMIRASLQDELAGLFRQLRKTVLFVTHDLAEAAFVADEIVLLRQGRIVLRGTARDLLERPTEPFVTEFVRAQRVGMFADGAR